MVARGKSQELGREIREGVEGRAGGEEVKSRGAGEESSCRLPGGEAELTDQEAGEGVTGQIASSDSADQPNQTKTITFARSSHIDQLNVNIYFSPNMFTQSIFSGAGTENKPLTVFHCFV